MARSSRPRPAVIGALVAAVLVTAGCTTTLDGDPAADPAPVPTEGPGSDPVAWADRLCEGVLSFTVPATSPPDFSGSTDLPALQRVSSDYLGAVVSGAQQGRQQLAAIGRAPEPAGDAAVDRAETALQGLEREFARVRSAVGAADASDPDAFLATLTQAESTIAATSPPDPLGDLRSAPRLQRAAERAPRCQQLSAVAANVPR